MLLKRKMLVASLVAVAGVAQAQPVRNITLEQIGRYETGVFDEGASEIVAFDAGSQKLFVINADAKSVDLLDLSNPALPLLAGVIDVSVDIADAGGVNSVAVHEGLVAIAVEHHDKQSNGWAAFYDFDGNYLAHFEAGALPDMITYTPDGRYVLMANEGEPSDDYSNDPEGSVTIIDIKKGLDQARVKTAGFRKYNGKSPRGVRISGPRRVW